MLFKCKQKTRQKHCNKAEIYGPLGTGSRIGVRDDIRGVREDNFNLSLRATTRNPCLVWRSCKRRRGSRIGVRDDIQGARDDNFNLSLRAPTRNPCLVWRGCERRHGCRIRSGMTTGAGADPQSMSRVARLREKAWMPDQVRHDNRGGPRPAIHGACGCAAIGLHDAQVHCWRWLYEYRDVGVSYRGSG